MSGPLGAWLIPDQHSPLIVALDRHLSRVGLQKRRAADGRRQVLQRKGVDQDLLRRLQETGGYRGNKPAEGKAERSAPSRCCRSPAAPPGTAGSGPRRPPPHSPLRSNLRDGSTSHFLGGEEEAVTCSLVWVNNTQSGSNVLP